MSCSDGFPAFALALLLSACVDNTAPGNDREAERDPAAPAAEVMSASAALDGVATGLLMPEIMTDADLRNLPPTSEGACMFRMTRVGFPVFVYGERAVIKLNGKLVPLAASGAGEYVADGVTATVRPLDGAEAGTLFAAEFVLRLPGAPNELGFHGFSQC